MHLGAFSISLAVKDIAAYDAISDQAFAVFDATGETWLARPEHPRAHVASFVGA